MDNCCWNYFLAQFHDYIKPIAFSQAPLGELNENKLGSGSEVICLSLDIRDLLNVLD